MPQLFKLPKIHLSKKLIINTLVVTSFTITISILLVLLSINTKSAQELASLLNLNSELNQKLEAATKEINDLKNRDEYQINQALESEIKSINETFTSSVSVYENLVKLQETLDNTDELEKLYTQSLLELSQKDYQKAQATLSELDNKIADENKKIAEAATKTQEETNQTPPNQTNNTPPSSGYSRQYVATNIGTFLVSLVVADLASTRVIVDTASDSTCPNNCPVLSLADYIARNNAWAGINGSYFCPASYPSCAGKENSFDLLLMNKNKTYFNSDNNVYSTNPAVIFGQGWIRFVGQALEWGRDTNIDSMLSNYPMLVQGGNIAFAGNADPKEGAKGGRSFVANKGNLVYIGVVHNATVGESAQVMHTLGMENALNLDDGGSTALWHGGYKVGPGRALPNAILFVQR